MKGFLEFIGAVNVWIAPGVLCILTVKHLVGTIDGLYGWLAVLPCILVYKGIAAYVKFEKNDPVGRA